MLSLKEVFLCVILAVLGSAVSAREYNVIHDLPQRSIPSEPSMLLQQPMVLQQTSSLLSIDLNEYDFLIYDCGTGEIQNAMTVLGLSYTVRNQSTPVTAQDLIDYDILIVGWNQSSPSSTDGLDPNIIDQGITGRVILTGHDTDWHTAANRWEQPYAEKFLIQSITYILEGSGTGLLAHGEPVGGFNWLPESWGIEVTDDLALEDVTAFTPDGVSSGIFDDLTTDNMSYWYNSFHNVFDEYGLGFKPFEMGMVNDVNSVITIAATVNPLGLIFWKEDDTEGSCRSVGDEITYTICYENTTDRTFSNVFIIDYLPEGVDYPEGDWQMDPNNPLNPLPPDPAYDPNTHSYIWSIGDMPPNDANCVSITVTVNQRAAPGVPLFNNAELWSGQIRLAEDTEETLVCCWTIDGQDPNIIYVDKTAEGFNNGMTWKDAYKNLQDALFRAGNSNCTPANGFTIYVAQGSYSPGVRISDTFALPQGVAMYGGFKTGGTNFIYRNPDRYKTFLNGLIDPNENDHNRNVVTMGDASLMDGFIVKEADLNGVYGNGASFTVENCHIIENGFGLYAENGNVDIVWCQIKNNYLDGIYHAGSGYSIDISNSLIIQNYQHGLNSRFSTPWVLSSVFAQNGSASTEELYYYGINILNPSSNPTLHNNTIARNKEAGVLFVNNDPNSTVYPDVQDCILWYNNDNHGQIYGHDPNHLYYNCIYDANDIDGTDYTLDANYNFTGNPGFAYDDPNQYDDSTIEFNPHLAYNSPCIEKGSPVLTQLYADHNDIDAEQRVVGQYIDIGADEVYSCDGDLTADDVYNQLDWNADGILNLKEAVYWSRAWLTHDPCDPALHDPNYPEYDDYNDPCSPDYVDADDLARWDAKCNLINTGDSQYFIDLEDLMEFCRNGYWLWTACWKQSQMDRFYWGTIPEAVESMSMSMPMQTAQTMTVEEQATNYAEIYVFLVNLWTNDKELRKTISKKDWENFIAAIENSFYGTESEF